MENIIVAALALLGTLAGAYLGNRKSAALIAYRLEELEKRVQAHNNLVERMFRAEEHIDLQEEKLKTVSRRIDDLERKAEA